MKYGIYIAESGAIHRGDIVAICLNKQWSSVGLRNNYLPAGNKCGETVPLIKQVIAVPGDTVILNENDIIVNGHVYHDKTMHIDGRGRVMTIYPRGLHQHIIGYFVIGNNAPNSWDSRYWGIVPTSQVLYKLKPILT